MPAWKGTLSDEEIQGVINYLRQLVEQSNHVFGAIELVFASDRL